VTESVKDKQEEGIKFTPELLNSIEIAGFYPRMKKYRFSVCKDTEERGNKFTIEFLNRPEME